MDAAHGKHDDGPIPEPFVPDFSEGLESGLYLALLELVDEGVIITGDERVLEANSAACGLLEREYREIVGQPLAQLFPSERDFIQARARLFIQGEMRGSLQVALPGERKRNLRFIAAARLRPGVHALILSRDLLAEAEAEPDPASPAPDALWPRLAAVLEQPVIVIDERARVSAANAAAIAGLNLERERLIGHALEPCIAVRWPTGDSTPFAHLTRGDGVELAARVLPGPKPGWRVLVLPATRRGDEKAHQAVARATRPHLDNASAHAATRLAIERNQLEIHFQALVDARDDRIRGGEALLRWHHPTHGLAPFGRIASLVDDPASIANMSDWALQTACAQAARWPADDGRDPRILTVNIAHGQVLKGDLLKRVETALATSGLAARRLELDFDESILSDPDDAIHGMLNDLSSLGVRLAIDDFGRGTASIPRLRRYPLTAIKLDPALVRRVGHDETSESIVEAISSMAAVLGLKIFARGVESAPQQAFLAALGCYLQQGPLLGAPMPTEAFAALLAPTVLSNRQGSRNPPRARSSG